MNTHIHTQEIPSAEWQITHGLNSYPTSEIRIMHEGAMTTILPKSVRIVNANAIVVEFSEPRTGEARLVGGYRFSLLGTVSNDEDEVTGDEHFDNVTLLVHFDGTDAATTASDVKGGNIRFYGNAALSDDVKAFGATSVYMNAGDSGIAITPTVVGTFDLGAEDFTMEAFVQRSTASVSTIMGNFRHRNGYRGGSMIQIDSDGSLVYHIYSGQFIRSTPGAVPVGSLHHIAVTRSGDDFKLFVDGEIVASGTNTTATLNQQDFGSTPEFDAFGDFHIGYHPSDGNLSSQFRGFIDEVRVTRGVARYTDAFDPPTEPFPDMGQE